MSALGSLVVEVAANVARFQSDMGKVAGIAEANAKKIDKAFGVVSTSLKAIGVSAVTGLTLDAIKNKIEGVIQSAAGLQQLAERTGATAASLSGLASVAKLSGTDTEALATSLQKLSKASVDAQDGGLKTKAAFGSLGISIKDLKGLRADEIFALIARRQAEYADGTGKTAAMQELLGRAGANMLPVMKDLAEVGDLQVKTTNEQARQADEYEKNIKRLDAAQGAMWKRIGLEVLPVMNDVAKALLDSATNTKGLKGEVDRLAADKSIRGWAEDAAVGLAYFAETLLTSGRAVGAVVYSVNAIVASLEMAYKASRYFTKGLFVGDKEQDAMADDLVAVVKRQMEAVQKADEAYVNLWNSNKTPISGPLLERLAASRYSAMNNFDPFGHEGGGSKPDVAFKPNTASNADALWKRQLQGQIQAQEAIIASTKKYLQHREELISHDVQMEYLTVADGERLKRKEIEDSLKEITEAYDREAAAVRGFIEKAVMPADREQGANELAQIEVKRAAAIVEAQEKMRRSKLSLLDIQRRFDLDTIARERADSRSNMDASFQIQVMGRSTLEVAKLTEARRIQLDLDERIYELRKKDAKADISGAVTQAAIQQARATSLIELAYNKQRSAVYGASEAVRKYAEDSANVGAQIESAMTSAFKGMEDALVQFVTTGKLNFRSLADSIIADIARIIVKQSITGPLAAALQGGIGRLFGGSDTVGSDWSTGNYARASGGPVAGGTPYLVGEKGPEMFVPDVSGQIVPNNQLGGGGVTIHQTLQISTGVAQTVRAEIMQMMPAIQRASVAAVVDARMRGGAVAAAFR